MIKLIDVFSLKGKAVLNGCDFLNMILSSQMLGFLRITWRVSYKRLLGATPLPGALVQYHWAQPKNLLCWQDPRGCCCCEFKEHTLRTTASAYWNK